MIPFDRAPKERIEARFYDYTEKAVRKDGITEEDGILHRCARCTHVDGHEH